MVAERHDLVARDVADRDGGPVVIERFDEAEFPEVAVVLREAYRGTVDDDDGDPIDALRLAARGEYGDPLPETFLRVMVDGATAAATMWTFWRGRPLVAFVFTHPDFQRRGSATALIRAAARHVPDGAVSLVVTAASPAVSTYRNLGFVEVDPPTAELGPASTADLAATCDADAASEAASGPARDMR